YVRPRDSFAHSRLGPVPLRSSAIAALVRSAFGLRSTRMEVADGDRLRCGSHLSLLASAVQRELGARHWTRTACRAGLAFPNGISGCGVDGRLLADPFIFTVVEPQTNTLKQTKSRMNRRRSSPLRQSLHCPIIFA